MRRLALRRSTGLSGSTWLQGQKSSPPAVAPTGPILWVVGRPTVKESLATELDLLLGEAVAAEEWATGEGERYGRTLASGELPVVRDDRRGPVLDRAVTRPDFHEERAADLESSDRLGQRPVDLGEVRNPSARPGPR